LLSATSRVGHHVGVSLLWRVFATNAAVILGAVVVLAATPGYIKFPNSLFEAAVGVAAIAFVLALNFFLLRTAFEPLRRLTALMRGIDLLRPGQRLEITGHGEVAVLGATFNEMLERLEAQRRESITVTFTAQEAERRRIARNLHDEIGQMLTAVLLQLDGLGKRVRPELQHEFQEAVEALRESLDQVRRIARELRPGVLDDLGLASALRELCSGFSERTGLRIDRSIAQDLPPLAPEKELALYRVAQESLTNVARHAEATTAYVRLEAEANAILLRVSDNGAASTAPQSEAQAASVGCGNGRSSPAGSSKSLPGDHSASPSS
jgi:two-component system sensor histidine kinase UhpB